MRKIKTSKKLAVSAFALAASATLLFPGNALAADKTNVAQVGGAYVVYTAADKKTVDTKVNGAYCIDDTTEDSNYENVLYFVDGKQSISYTGLAKYESEETDTKLLYFNNGVVDVTKTGIVEFEGKQYYVKAGVVPKTTPSVEDGIVFADAGKTYDKTSVYYVKNDVVTPLTGLVHVANIATEAAKVDDNTVAHILYFKNGVMDLETEGFVRDGKKLFYVKKGEVLTKTADADYELAVRPYAGSYVLTTQEAVDSSTEKFTVAAITSEAYSNNKYTGSARNPKNGTYWYVKDNYVSFGFNKVVKADAAINEALVADTVVTDGDLVKFTNGQYDNKYTGFAAFNANVTYYMVDGEVATVDSFNTNTGIDYENSVRPLNDGKNTWAFIVKDADDNLVAAANTVEGIGTNPNNGTQWVVKKGVVDFNYTGAVADANDDLFMAVNGQIVDNYTGFGTMKVIDGTIAKTVYVYFEKGENKVLTGVRPLGDEANTWVYVSGGIGDFGYTGIAQNPKNETKWLVEAGKVNFGFTGKYTPADEEDTVYEVVNGQVISSTTKETK